MILDQTERLNRELDQGPVQFVFNNQLGRKPIDSALTLDSKNDSSGDQGGNEGELNPRPQNAYHIPPPKPNRETSARLQINQLRQLCWFYYLIANLKISSYRQLDRLTRESGARLVRTKKYIYILHCKDIEKYPWKCILITIFLHYVKDRKKE